MEEEANGGIRFVVGVALPAVLVLATVLPLFLWSDRLPDPMATHWGGGNRPNGTMSQTAVLLFDLTFVAIAAIVIAVVARRQPAHRGDIAPAVAIATFIGSLVTTINALIVAANLDAASWADAKSVGFAEIGLSLVIAAAVTTGATVLARSLETAPEPVPVRPSAGIKPRSTVMSDDAIWVGVAHSRWAVPVCLLCGALAVILGVGIHPWAALFALLLVPIMIPFTSIRVQVDRSGVQIAYGALGWPLQRVPMAEIEEALVIDLRPMKWGGWGYRGALRMFGKAAIVLRAGPAIELHLTGGRILVVTVDDAEHGAGVVNDLRMTVPPPR